MKKFILTIVLIILAVGKIEAKKELIDVSFSKVWEVSRTEMLEVWDKVPDSEFDMGIQYVKVYVDQECTVFGSDLLSLKLVFVREGGTVKGLYEDAKVYKDGTTYYIYNKYDELMIILRKNSGTNTSYNLIIYGDNIEAGQI